MCGLVGSFHPKGAAATDEVINRMRDRMTHRGPDGADTWRDGRNKCALAHRRLSIIDLSTSASQPMKNDDGSIVIVFNGEIYNHAEIRAEISAKREINWQTDHSDTEVILRAYEMWGVDCVDKFYGMFAIAIYDQREINNPKLHLIRDRVGVKPLYISKLPSGEWIFGSEIRALLEHPQRSRDMDKTAFWHYLTFIVAPAPLTLFRDIFKLPAGTRVTIDAQGEAVSQQWWDCAPNKKDMFREKDLSFDEASDEFLRLMRQSISRRMVSDVPFGVLLSGGVDSSLNVALMSELMDQPVKTFTVGYETHAEFNEYDYATQLSKRYNTDHHEVRINSDEALDFLPNLVEIQDEPIADNVCIPLYFLSKLVRDSGTTVVQVGEGADENFLGYWWCDHYRQKYENLYRPMRDNGRTSFLQRLLGKSKNFIPTLNDGEDELIKKRFENGQQLFWGGAVCWWGDMRDQLTPNAGPFQQEVNCPVKGMMPDSHREYDSSKVVGHYLDKLGGKLTEPEILQQIPYLEMKLRLSEHLLMRVDKMTMAHSIEARVPFLDHDMVDFARRLPPSYKLDDGLGKKLVKKAAEPYVDHDLLYRRKQGFGAPMDKWFTEERFGKRCLDMFENSTIKKEGYFDNEYIGDLLKNQVDGKINYGFHLWTIMNAVMWHERWIANESAG